MYNLRKNKMALAKSQSVDVGADEIVLKERLEAPEVKSPEERRSDSIIKAHAHFIRYVVIIIIAIILILAGGLHIARSFTHDPSNPEAVSRLEASEARLRTLFSCLINLLLGHPNPAIGALASKPEVKWLEKTFSDTGNGDDEKQQLLKSVDAIMTTPMTNNSSNINEYISTPESRDHTVVSMPSTDAFANSTSLE